MISALFILSATADPLQDYLQSFVERGVPGISVTMVHPDGTVTNATAGVSDEKGTPLTAEDRFLAGSTGKTFFAAWAMALKAEDVISLDDKAIKWVKDKALVRRLPNGGKVTLRQLMNHTSGIPEHVQESAFIKALHDDPNALWSPEKILHWSEGREPLSVPGEAWSYADTNYILLAYALESATSCKAYDEIQRRFLGPLDLAYTEPSTRRTMRRVVTGHMFAGNPFGQGPTKKDGRLLFNPQFEWAGGGFVSNPSDLALWMFALAGGTILPEEQTKEMTNGIPAKTGRGHSYGLGLQIRPVGEARTIGHSGWYPGYLTDVHYWPDQKVAVCVMTSTDDQKIIGVPLERICDEVRRLAQK